jgi:hypothetical protein
MLARVIGSSPPGKQEQHSLGGEFLGLSHPGASHKDTCEVHVLAVFQSGMSQRLHAYSSRTLPEVWTIRLHSNAFPLCPTSSTGHFGFWKPSGYHQSAEVTR